MIGKIYTLEPCHTPAPEGHPHPVAVMNLIGDEFIT